MGSRKSQRFGRYEIVAELGRGAMGVVYQARDPKIDRLVAIKTISMAGQDPEQESEFRERFFLEARAAGRLSHPGIVTIYDVGEEPGNRAPYIVMEHVAGETLQKLLAHTNKLAFGEALQYAQELAEALDYAHAQGVVHRDIKPANIMITEDGHAKIADFGIAKLNFSNLTLAGHALGTPAYMAPEQLEGEQVDGRADLFSIGVIIYLMLTGHRPFQGNSAYTVSFKVVNKDPVPATAFNADFPPELDYVIGRAMAKDKDHRYQTGREMALDIKELLRGRAPRSIGDPVKTEHSKTSSALQAIHDVVPLLGRASGGGTAKGRIHGRPSRFPLGREMMMIFAACLVVAVVFLAFRHPRTVPPSHTVEEIPAQSTSVGNAAATAVAVAAVPTKPASLGPAQVAPGIATEAQQPASQPVAYKKEFARTAGLQIKIEHHFTSANFSVWVDNRLAYHHALEGVVKKRLVLFHEVKGTESAKIRLAPGKHEIKVKVESDSGYDQVRTVATDLAPHATGTLHVDCSGQQEMSVSVE